MEGSSLSVCMAPEAAIGSYLGLLPTVWDSPGGSRRLILHVNMLIIIKPRNSGRPHIFKHKDNLNANHSLTHSFICCFFWLFKKLYLLQKTNYDNIIIVII